jgi:Holliday junction resolvase
MSDKPKKRINAKAKGTRLELKTMRVLEKAGYKTCRSAASLGEWDVIAVGATNVRLVQVKANRRPGSVEMETLRSFVAPSNCSREVWVWKDRAREPIIEVL